MLLKLHHKPSDNANLLYYIIFYNIDLIYNVYTAGH